MNYIDIFVILFILFGMYLGYKKGAIYSIITLISSIIIFIVSFYLKGPISILLMQVLPFEIPFDTIKGIDSIKVLIYEVIAFALCESILNLILNLVLKFTGIIQKTSNLLKSFATLNRILGAIFGGFKNYVSVFFILFIISLIPVTSKVIDDSYFGNVILNNTPILSNITKDYKESFNQLYKLIDMYQNIKDNNNIKIDYDMLDMLLKYDVISVDKLKELNENYDLGVENIDDLIKKYEK